MNRLLAAELSGSPLIELIDTFMYGFWGEGHTWPFTDNAFPDYATAERTWMHMLDVQLEYWNKTPLVTNTQPDFSVVGDAEMLDHSIRTHNSAPYSDAKQASSSGKFFDVRFRNSSDGM